MVNCSTKWWLCATVKCVQSLIRTICRSQDVALILVLCHIDVFCLQTQIYEAEYETEHNDHKHTLQENRKLRKKREEMRQQVALLQEQVVFKSSVHMQKYTFAQTITFKFTITETMMCLGNSGVMQCCDYFANIVKLDP